MFTLVTIADVVLIPPADFNKPSFRAIEDFVNTKYADKIIPKIGLGIGFHSLISASEGLIGHGTGIVNVNVDFRLVVFRPFKGEIIRATIENSVLQSGIQLSMDFFEDLVVPPETLPDNTQLESDEPGGVSTYVWKADDGEGGFNEYYFDKAESCMLRVEEEIWNEVVPDPTEAQDTAPDPGRQRAPYLVRGSMIQAGLGPTLWWSSENMEDANGS